MFAIDNLPEDLVNDLLQYNPLFIKYIPKLINDIANPDPSVVELAKTLWLKHLFAK